MTLVLIDIGGKMRKLLLYLLIFSIVLIPITGCSKKEAEEKQWSEPPRQKDTMYIYYPQWAFHHVLDSAITKWENYMLDKYGKRINLTYTSSMIQTMISTDTTPTPLPQESGVTTIEKPEFIKNLEELSDFEGFVYVHDFSTLNKLIEYDMIVPVEQYISQIPFYSGVEPSIIESFTDSFYRTWAFPLSVLPPSTSKRIYDKALLEKSGMSVPVTLEELHEFAKLVSNQNPNENGGQIIYLTQFTPTKFEYEFQDIFRAFGCYTSMNNLINYNPHSDKYECAFTNENFIEAMNYIMLLWDEGLIKYISDQEWFDRVEQDHAIASSYNNALLTDLEPDNRTYGFYLTGYNESRLIELKNRTYAFAVLKHTENVGKTIDEFFTMMQSSPDSRNDLLIGIKGENYFDYDSHYERISSEDPMDVKPVIAIYTFLDEETYYNKPTLSVPSKDKLGSLSNISTSIETRLEYKKAEDLILPYLGTPMVYQNTFDRYSSDLLKLNRDVSNMWFKFIRAIFDDDMQVDDAYAKLIREFEFYNMQERIDMLNQ